MTRTFAAAVVAACILQGAQPGPPARPVAGPVEIIRSSEIRRGMTGVAWTVFEGTEPEPIPVEIIGLWKNVSGPRQDVILAKLGGKAARTNVAGGMSGSPVYIDGKLAGAIALRISVFSPDTICGITPIEQMLEISEIDDSRPANSKSPQTAAQRAELVPPAGLLDTTARFVPIEMPLAFSGFHEATLKEFRPYFDQMGVVAVHGGAGGALLSSSPAPGWQQSLNPGEVITGVLVGGDMSVTGLGTVTYNNGKRVLGFGHSFFNLGPVNMPMSKGEVLMVLSSQFQPNKLANATEVVGALRQDRHSGILGELGATAETIPVSLTVRSRPQPGSPVAEKRFRYEVFSHPRWTPFLMMLTTFNTIQDLNIAASDDITFRLRGTAEVEGAGRLEVANRTVTSEIPMPPSMQIATWWAEKFNRLYQNPSDLPKIRKVDAVLEAEPERRTAAIESAWLDSNEADENGELSGKVLLRPWRGDRFVKAFRVKLPGGLTKGEYRLLISDSDTLNRAQMMAGMMNRTLDVKQTVSLLNQERPNDRFHVSLIESRPTAYADDKALPALPPSVLSVMQAGRTGRPIAATPETARTLESVQLDWIVAGSASLRFAVK